MENNNSETSHPPKPSPIMERESLPVPEEPEPAPELTLEPSAEPEVTFIEPVPMRMAMPIQVAEPGSLIPRNNIMSHQLHSIFVEHICRMLEIEDLLALRGVNIWFYQLMNEPSLWRRIESVIEVPSVPIRPSFQAGNRKTQHEYQERVARAISMEDNWRKENPTVFSTMTLPGSHEVLEMTLVPGGKYLAVSVRDDYRFFIVIYHLDHPNGPHALARFPTVTKSYGLEAKYMPYKEVDADGNETTSNVLMIAYFTREYVDPNGDASDDISKYANDDTPTLDPVYPVRYSVHCVRVELEALELLSAVDKDPSGSATAKHKLWLSSSRHQDRPFKETYVHNDPHHFPFGHMSLFVQSGVPMLCFVSNRGSQGETVNFVDLYTGIKNSITPPPLSAAEFDSYEPHTRILAIRPLPNQRQFIAFRSLAYKRARHELNTKNHTSACQFLEMYDIPLYMDRQCDPIVVAHVDDLKVHYDLTLNGCQISDFHLTSHENATLQQGAIKELPPISVYFETTNGKLYHWIIWPTKDDTRSPAVFYNFRWLTKQTVHQRDNIRLRVIPGAFRSLICMSRSDDRRSAPALISLRRYISPEYQFRGYPSPRINRLSEYQRTQLRRVPKFVFATLPLRPETLSPYQAYGLGAIAWDESIGRVCMATGGGKTIEIFDFSHKVKINEKYMGLNMLTQNPEGDGEWEDDDDEWKDEMEYRDVRSKRALYVVPDYNELRAARAARKALEGAAAAGAGPSRSRGRGRSGM
ncbi:hypothetical protein H0H93_000561 [Arthromyces matolae]|nr:hypothetical protein H0H93_000561 [Arthromyces matolae]